jgi:LacI family transcriptional regulator
LIEYTQDLKLLEIFGGVPVRRKLLGLFVSPTTDNDRYIIRGVVDFVQKYQEWEIDTHYGAPGLPWELLGRWRGNWDLIMRRWKGDGIIANVWDQGQYQLLRRKHLPVVNVIARVETPGMASVYSDDWAIGRQAAEHLTRMGLRQFATIVRPELYHDMRRGQGFTETLKEAGFSCEQIELSGPKVSPVDTAAQRFIVRQLRQLEYPLGIFAAHDNSGCLVLEACRRRHIEVPYQVSVLGVGNFELLCETCRPPMSSIPQRARQIGYEAANLLDQIVKGKAKPDTRILMPPGELVPRRSTDFLAIDDSVVCEALRFIRGNFLYPITVEDVAGKVTVSRRTLDKRFIDSMGHSPAREISLMRIRRAQELLANAKEQIVVVATRSGFASLSSFNSVFREATGLTPSEYRRQYTMVAGS